MADFKITVSDKALLDGITWAREEHNRNDLENLLKTDQEYIQFVIQRAVESYSQQKIENEIRKKLIRV